MAGRSLRIWLGVAPAWLGLGVLVLIAALLSVLVTRVGRVETELDALNRRAQVTQDINRQLETVLAEGLWVHGPPLTGDPNTDFNTLLDAEIRYLPLFVDVQGVVGVDGRVEVSGRVDADIVNREPLPVTVVNSDSNPVPVKICPDGALFGRCDTSRIRLD